MRRAVALYQGQGARDAWYGIPTFQVDEAGSAIRDSPCSNSESIQPWARGSSRHLVRAQHYRELRISAFSDWSRAAA
jgi:hypothetical protein